MQLRCGMLKQKFLTEYTKDAKKVYWTHKRCKDFILYKKMRNFVTEYTKDAKLYYGMFLKSKILLLNTQ
jgi:hypothetical protein